jgi:O-antigen ligase
MSLGTARAARRLGSDQPLAAPERGAELAQRVLDGFPEAAWLFALTSAPVAFHVMMTRNFDLIKTLWFRGTMSLVVVVAILAYAAGPWLRGEGENGRILRGLTRLQRAAITCAFAVLLSALAATVFSVLPRISLSGSHLRNFGLFSEAMHVVLFLSVVAVLRRREQLHRALDTLVLVGAFTGLYGIAQATGLDPLRGGFMTPGEPLLSTVGNASYYGELIVVAMVVTAARLAAARERVRGASESSPTLAPGFNIAVGAIAGLVQLVLLLRLTGSSTAPWWLSPLVLLFGLALLCSDSAIAPRRWGPRCDAAVYAALFVLQVVCLALTGSRTAWIAAAIASVVFVAIATRQRRLRLAVGLTAILFVTLSGLGLVATMEESPVPGLGSLPGVARVTAVMGARKTLEGRIAIWNDILTLAAAGGQGVIDGDPFHVLRPLVGYGPGALYVVDDRFTSVRRLHFEPARIDRAHNEMLDRLVTMGAFGLSAWLALTGVVLALAVRAVPAGGASHQRWSVAGVASGLIGLIVNDLSGPGDPTSRIYFWFLAGVLTSSCWSRVAADVVPVPAPRRGTRTRVGEPLAASAVIWRAGETIVPGRAALVLLATVALLPVGLAAAMVVALPPTSSTIHLGLTAALASGLLFVLAAQCGWRDGVSIPSAPRFGRGPQLAFVGVLGVMTALLMFRNLRPAEADMYNRLALLASGAGDKPVAISLAQQAIAISPNEELYYMILGGSMADIASVAPDRPSGLPPGPPLDFAVRADQAALGRLSRADFLTLGEACFERASQLNPLDSVHYMNLVRMATLRMDMGDPAAKEHALALARLGLSLSPMNRTLYDDYVRLGGT